MKLRLCVSLVLACLLNWPPLLWAATPGQDDNATNARPVIGQDNPNDFNQLTANAVDEGSIQVLVVLNTSPVTSRLPQDVAQPVDQEHLIESQQNAILKDIPLRRTQSIKRYKHLLYLAMSADENELQRLRNSPHVARIIRDKINFPVSHEFSINKVGADLAWGFGFTGVGQTIAVIDNGVDKRHPYLRGKVLSEACFSTRNARQKITPTCRNGQTSFFGKGAANVKCRFQDFGCTHGTLITALAAGNSLAAGFASSGVAPNAAIIAVKADSFIRNRTICAPARSCSVFYDSDLLRGLDFVYRKRRTFNIAAINVSIGGKASDQECQTSPIRSSVAKLRAANIATVAASGNEGLSNQIDSPACVPGVVSIGASDLNNAVLPFSNSSTLLSLMAPGKDIGLIMPGVVPPGFEIVASGTSLSAAFVSGAWASLKAQKTNATVDEILAALTRSGIPLFDPKNGLTKPEIQVNTAHNSLVP